jgi:cell division protein FtsW (lipid II flippase)
MPTVPQDRHRRGERRLPMALAVLVAAVLYLFIPEQFRLTEVAHYVYPMFLFVLVLILVIGDPGRIDREQRWLRVTTGVMVATITIATAYSPAAWWWGSSRGRSSGTPPSSSRSAPSSG